MDDLIGHYETRDFPAARLLSVDFTAIGLTKHFMTAMLEFDVTMARRLIREYRHEGRGRLSFLAWFVRCIGQAVSEHREVQGFIGRGRRLVLFDDVDIAFIVEKETSGARIPVPFILRKADAKSLDAIDSEIRAAQAEGGDDGLISPGELPAPWALRLYPFIPAPIRRFLIRMALRNPYRAKRMMGTVALTAIGMYGKIRGWAVPIGVHPICFAVGSIVDKPAIVDGRPEAREFLQLTVLIDHDVVDGAPAARFMNRLKQLVEGGYGLADRDPDRVPGQPPRAD